MAWYSTITYIKMDRLPIPMQRQQEKHMIKVDMHSTEIIELRAAIIASILANYTAANVLDGLDSLLADAEKMFNWVTSYQNDTPEVKK